MAISSSRRVKRTCARHQHRLTAALAAVVAWPVLSQTHFPTRPAVLSARTATSTPSARTLGAGGYSTVPIASGKGTGLFSQHSNFKPLTSRGDVLSWEQLAALSTKLDGKKILPQFTPTQTKLDKKMQRVQGYIMPLHVGSSHRHFLLTSVPMTCAFCVPGGPESMVEIRSKTTIAYTTEPITLQGLFALLPDDERGLYYSLSDAVLFQ
jgi:uncharacterized protein